MLIVSWLAAIVVGGMVCFEMLRTWYRKSLYWTWSERRLRVMLPKVRAGEIPIEELSRAGEPMNALVPMIQDLCRDLRQQQAVIAGLDHELSQKVAHRTGALERTIQSLRHQASSDVLTGLYNRRALETKLPEMMQKCRQQEKDLSLLMMDVDNFKLLNDLRGHVVGDEFLKSLGQLIRSSIRATDAAFRYGGDEFVIVLPNCGPGPAEQIGQRLVETVEQLVKPMKLDRPPGLSMGLNALSRHESHVDATTLLDGADCALYAQKAQRRRPTKPAQPAAA
ncbi:MAG: GGDEF domain-containing protein [Phycisphaerales bacterium]|nr:GGDEF domain-containing protein [Phycisphaerales bacterium]